MKVLKPLQIRPCSMLDLLFITLHHVSRCPNLCFSLNLYQLPNPLSLINLKRQLIMGKLLHNKQELLILCVLIVSAFSVCSDTNCNDCTGNDDVCKSCKANFELTGSSCTPCSPGKFNPLGSTAACSSCSSGCIACTDASTCQQCKPGYGFANSQCSACRLGSFSDGKNPCAQCSTGCSICSSPTVCTTCASFYYLTGTACLTSCPNGYISSQNPNICYNCDATCLTCTGPQANQCISCSGNLALTPSGTCSSTCPQSFYSSGNKCTICPKGCISCSSATVCTKSNCLAGQIFVNGQCSQCSGGKGSKAGAVGTCTQSCGTNCLSCSVADDGTKTCIQSNCQAGQYLDSSNNCVSCTGSKGSLAGAVSAAACSVSCGSSNCVACSASLTGAKTCVASNCVQGSYFDQISFSCQSCTGGKGSAAESLTCGVTCTVANCDSCKADGTSCISCKAGYSLSSGVCTICLGGGSQVGATSCLTSCSTGCAACAFSPSGIQTCLTSSCTKGNYFDNSQLKCVACTGGKGSKDGALTCDISCYTGCSSCSVDSSGAQVCLTSTCPAGTYADDSQSKCTLCPSGKGSADNSIGPNSCFNCESTCSSCFATNSANSCLTCATTSYKPQNGVCSSSTCTGTAKLDSTLNVCYNCNTNCLDCDHIKTSLCISCATNLNLNPLTQTCASSCPKGYYAKTGKCLLCPPGCTSCQFQTSSSSVVCSGCNTGYYAQGSTCTPCSSECTACISSADNCLSCAPDYYLSKTTCYKACLPGYTLPVGSQVCSPCTSSCSSCIQGSGFLNGNCNACSVSTGLSSDGASICGPCLANCAACVNGYYFNQGSFTCNKCPTGSTATNSAASCTVCSNGFVPNSDSSSCVPCLSGCSVCAGGYQLATGTCTPCNNGFISTTGGVCTACPANQISNLDHTRCIFCTQKGFVPNADRSACVPCEIKCLACPINYGYSSRYNTCRPCGPDSASDGTRLCTTCKPGQIPSSTGTCVNCQTGCSICAVGFGYNSFSQTCTACSLGFISPGIDKVCQKCPTDTPQVPNADISACVQCQKGYIVSQDLMSCILCKTGCTVCPANYGLSNGICTPCSSGSSSDGTKQCSLCSIAGCSSCPIASNKCSTCLPTLYVSADGSACNPCSSAMTIDQCSQSSCGGYFFLNSSCIGNCSVLSRNMTSPKPTNGTCGCPSGSVWTLRSTFTGCLPCSDSSITQTQCLSSQCSLFLWSTFGQISFCTSCALQGATKGPNGTCICLKGQYWDTDSKYCIDCASAPSSYCGISSSCPQYYLDATLTCQACGSNTAITRPSSIPQTVCPCVTGFVWSSNNATCIKSVCKASQYYLNGVCKDCPTLNVLQKSRTSVANGSVCVCLKNYQFIFFSGAYACGCDNTVGSFDLGNQVGCGTCQKIAGAVTFDGSVNQCTCVSGSSWNSNTYSCQCATPNSFFKFGTLCTLCTDPAVNGALVNTKDTTSCTCEKEFVWSAALAQCICKTANQFYQTTSAKASCKACDKTLTAGTIVAYYQCQCNLNQVWDPATQTCKCIAGSIYINKACFFCSSDPFGVAPSTDGKACTCKTNWEWSTTKRACLCKANVICDCSSLPNTGFSPKNSICSSCSSLDTNALAVWPTGETQCGCNSIKYAWQSSTGTCICVNTNPAIPAILVNKNKLCVLCDRTVNSINSVNGSFPSSSCVCYPNYVWSATKFSCTYNSKSAGVVNLAISGGSTDKSCNNISAKAVSVSALDNFNCICAVRTSIFNDLTGQCISCGTFGSQNSVTCKCGKNQAWSVLMMKCISTSPPGGLYDNPSYAKCVQSIGLASANLIAFTPTDSNQVTVSGEADFAALANQSPLYAPFAAFKCDCAPGYGWNQFRRRCYPIDISNTY